MNWRQKHSEWVQPTQAERTHRHLLKSGWVHHVKFTFFGLVSLLSISTRENKVVLFYHNQTECGIVGFPLSLYVPTSLPESEYPTSIRESLPYDRTPSENASTSWAVTRKLSNQCISGMLLLFHLHHLRFSSDNSQAKALDISMLAEVKEF